MSKFSGISKFLMVGVITSLAAGIFSLWIGSQQLAGIWLTIAAILSGGLSVYNRVKRSEVEAHESNSELPATPPAEAVLRQVTEKLTKLRQLKSDRKINDESRKAIEESIVLLENDAEFLRIEILFREYVAWEGSAIREYDDFGALDLTSHMIDFAILRRRLKSQIKGGVRLEIEWEKISNPKVAEEKQQIINRIAELLKILEEIDKAAANAVVYNSLKEVKNVSRQPLSLPGARHEITTEVLGWQKNSLNRNIIFERFRIESLKELVNRDEEL
jgi:hypothetical protein